ncbi:hypothetical protein AB0J72_05315 [Dactylosporangium sp. NPDC049742]|uniref:hypothetical protein n=1 Tax=Dactylosporangium sp. NPDC049742 TaxID=3154737 RepID=UPI00341B9B9A
MSDFDDVLERLLTDPGFQARLAADPAGALAGYQLSADELELLQAQVGGADAGQSRVEQRTSKASMFGLFSSIGSGIGDVVHGHGGGPSFDHGAGHNLGDGDQGSGAAHSAARGLGALEQSGGRHAAPEPEHQHGGLAAHVQDAVGHGAHASAGGAEAHAGPGGAYASAGGVEAQAGYGGAGFDQAQPGYGDAGLAEAPDPQGAGLSEAPDDPRSYASAGYGGDQDGGYGGLSEASDDPRSYASAGYGGDQDGGYGGLAEAPDPQGSEGLAEASPYGVSEVHSSGQGTVYRSASAGIGEAVGQGAHAGSGHAEAGVGGAHADAGFGEAQAHAQADGGGRHGIAGGLDNIAGAHQPGHGSGTGVAGGIAGTLRDGVPGGVGQAPTDGYHTRVDWDGDGRWDQHTYVNRADGGVDIVVDADGDGRAEFVGHDTDRDGLINSSEIDTNRDGVMDQRYEDLNGDGWLDRRTR